MRDPRQSFFDRFKLIPGILVGGAFATVGQIALAGPEDLGAMQAAPVSTAEAATAPLTGPQFYSDDLEVPELDVQHG